MDATPEQIRDHFLSRLAQYQAFTHCVLGLTVTLLEQREIGVHSISHRVKESQSLYEKLNRPGKGYGQLGDVTDFMVNGRADGLSAWPGLRLRPLGDGAPSRLGLRTALRIESRVC